MCVGEEFEMDQGLKYQGLHKEAVPDLLGRQNG
jgi:hypothetical protein